MKKVYFRIICVIILCGVGIGEYYLYQDTKRQLNLQAIIILKEVSGIYFNNEYTKLKIPFVSRRKSDKDISRTRSVTDKNGKVVVLVSDRKDSLSLSSTVDGRRKEFIVLKKCRLSADSIRQQWNNLLLENGINSENALRLTVTSEGDKREYLSYSDSLTCKSSYQLDSLYGGWQYELVVEPFINYSYFTVIERDNRFRILFIVGGGVVILLLLWLFTKDKTSIKANIVLKKPNVAIAPTTGEFFLDQQCFSLGDLLYDSSKGKLIISGKEVKLRPQLQTLLDLFMKAPDHYVTREEIIDVLWEGKLFANDSVRRVIRDLRSILEEEKSTIKLISAGRGFQLVIDNEEIVLLD